MNSVSLQSRLMLKPLWLCASIALLLFATLACNVITPPSTQSAQPHTTSLPQRTPQILLSPPPTPNVPLLRQLIVDYMKTRTPNDIVWLRHIGQNVGLVEGKDVTAFIVRAAEPLQGSALWPIVIASYYYNDFTRGTLLFNWIDSQWQIQDLPYFGDARVSAAKQTVRNGQGELVIAYQLCGACSASSVAFDLWRWDGVRWQTIWNMKPSGEQKLHGEVWFLEEFRDPNLALDTIIVRYSSWKRSDEKSRIFAESNPSPHRWFRETWRREGDAYRLAETTTELSAYNALVEFVFALRHGDYSAAQRWVIDPALVNRARSFGLDKVPDDTLFAPSDRAQPEWTPLWFLFLKNSTRLMIRLVGIGTDWRIEAIESLPLPTPTP